MSRRLLYGLMSLVVLMWGGAFVAIKFLLIEGLSVWTIALVRFVLTVGGLWAVVIATRTPMPVPERRHLPWIAVMGLCGVAAYHLALNFGERYISPNVAPLIIAAMPVVVAVLAAFVLHEHMTGAKWAGIALAIAGVVVLVLWGTPGAQICPQRRGGGRHCDLPHRVGRVHRAQQAAGGEVRRPPALDMGHHDRDAAAGAIRDRADSERDR